MAYTVTDAHGRSWVRLINLQGKRPRLMRAFFTRWVCDPCNPSRRRYQVTHAAGVRDHAWYEVITNDDDHHARACKLRHAAQVIAAAQTLAAAENSYRRLID